MRPRGTHRVPAPFVPLNVLPPENRAHAAPAEATAGRMSACAPAVLPTDVVRQRQETSPGRGPVLPWPCLGRTGSAARPPAGPKYVLPGLSSRDGEPGPLPRAHTGHGGDRPPAAAAGAKRRRAGGSNVPLDRRGCDPSSPTRPPRGARSPHAVRGARCGSEWPTEDAGARLSSFQLSFAAHVTGERFGALPNLVVVGRAGAGWLC